MAYQFFISDAYSTRPYGLTVSLFYRDAVNWIFNLYYEFILILIIFKDKNQYSNAVFNETVSIIELDEGLDGETFFLYVFLAAVLVLVGIVSQQFLSKLSVSCL